MPRKRMIAFAMFAAMAGGYMLSLTLAPQAMPHGNIVVCGAAAKVVTFEGLDAAVHVGADCAQAYLNDAAWVVEVFRNDLGSERIVLGARLQNGYCMTATRGQREESWGVAIRGQLVQCGKSPSPRLAVGNAAYGVVDLPTPVDATFPAAEVRGFDEDLVPDEHNVDHNKDTAADTEAYTAAPATTMADPTNCQDSHPVDVPYDVVDALYDDIHFKVAVYRRTTEVGDIVSDHIRNQGHWDAAKSTWILDQLAKSPGSTFIDIGANLGWFATLAAVRGYSTYVRIDRTRTHSLLPVAHTRTHTKYPYGPLATPCCC